jgi:hypothetical protein
MIRCELNGDADEVVGVESGRSSHSRTGGDGDQPHTCMHIRMNCGEQTAVN